MKWRDVTNRKMTRRDVREGCDKEGCDWEERDQDGRESGFKYCLVAIRRGRDDAGDVMTPGT